MMKKIIKCHLCLETLSFENNVTFSNSLLHFKNKGGLTIPNSYIFSICLETEKSLQRELKISVTTLLNARAVSNICTNTLIMCHNKRLFTCLDFHLFDSSPTCNHVILLIKCCIESYLKIRMHHIGKMFNEKVSGQKIRNKFCKLVLFKNQ